MNSVLIVLPILTLLMFDLGLALKMEDFALFLRRPKPVAVGLLGQIVLLPVVAFALASALDLPPIFFVGLVLIACCPGGSSSNVFSRLAGGDVALSVSLTALSSVITLFTLPLVMSFVVDYVGGESVDVHLPVGKLLVQNLLLMFLPIILGMLIRWKWPSAALSMDRVLSKIAFPCLILLAGIFFIQHRATIVEQFPVLGSAVTVLILLCMGGGWLLCKAFRLSAKEERTLIIEIGMQNAAQSIAVASSPFIFNNSQIAIPAILYALMMNVILLIYVAVAKIR